MRNGTLGIARSFGVLALVWTAFGCGKATDGGASQVVDPGRKDIHRLNSAEYNATVHDLLGTTLQPATHGWRGGELAGFDNIASVLGVDESQYGRYLGAARDLVTEVLASDGLRGRFVACTLADPACVRASIQSAGLRLFRRPLEPEEVTIYQRVYDTGRGLGDDEPAAFGLALQALLASAEFLYRIEIDPQRDSIAAHPLGPFELASRLSYFIWSSAPDDALLATAADGSLTQPGTLAASVDRMLDDPRSERLVTNFAGQWLGAREVLSHPVAPNYVRWSRSVAQAASAEILLYFSDFLRSGRSWLDFPSADVNLVDSALAHFYGMPDSTATEVGVPVRVEYRDDQRAGYFGLAGFLAVSSFDRRTSPSRRGRWIASTLLCSDPPPPPANVPELEEGDPDAGVDPSKLDVRRSLEKHRTDPRCATCHAVFDGYGLALEAYDAVGLYRSSYDDGAPVDVSAAISPSITHPEGLTFSGLDGLARVVSADPRFSACVARKLLSYGLGRVLTAGDDPHLRRALGDWLAPGQTPNLRRLIHALVATEAFRFRRGAG